MEEELPAMQKYSPENPPFIRAHTNLLWIPPHFLWMPPPPKAAQTLACQKKTHDLIGCRLQRVCSASGQCSPVTVLLGMLNMSLSVEIRLTVRTAYPVGNARQISDMFAQKSIVNKEASAKENVIAPPQVALC